MTRRVRGRSARVRAAGAGARGVGVAFMLAATASGLGCGAPVLSLSAEPRAFTGRDYPRVYADWTRHTHAFAFRRLAHVLHATATFESHEFRWAYVVRYAEDHALSTEQRAELLAASREDALAHHRFFVTLAGPNFRESDLTGERSAWRVLLVDEDGRQTLPVEIERVARPTAADRAYFPSIGPQRQAFRLAFPTARPDGSPTVPPDARAVVLRFTGPAGVVDLRWRVEPAADRGSTAGTSAL